MQGDKVSTTARRSALALAFTVLLLLLWAPLGSSAFAADDTALTGGTPTGTPEGQQVDDAPDASSQEPGSAQGGESPAAEKASVSEAQVTFTETAFVYTGSQIQPNPTVTLNGKALVRDVDYTLSYVANKNAGKAKVVISGTGNYAGTKTVSFKIRRAGISKATVAKLARRTYTGSYHKPKPTVVLKGKKLKRNRDYTLAYKSNKNAGIAQIVIRGVGNYTGKKTVAFKIARAPLAKAKVFGLADRVFTGKPLKPIPVVSLGGKKLKLNRDYTLAYKANRKIGTARIILKGKGNYSGWKIASFNIVDWVSKLNVAQSTNQLIIVVADGTRAVVSMHVKGADGFWRQVIWTDDGWVGSEGVGDAYEGSCRTPTGVMYPDMAFGIYEDPGCKMGYTQVDWSHYWCCDTESDLYNQFVSTSYRSDFNLYVSEQLAACGRAYNYCLNMGWNADCVPGRGSAFFLHCTIDGPTAGCVTVPEDTMVDILRTVEPGCAMVIDTAAAIVNY